MVRPHAGHDLKPDSRGISRRAVSVRYVDGGRSEALINFSSFAVALHETGALFPKQFHMDLPWWGIGLCAVMGIIAGLQSGLLTTLLYRIEDAFEALPIHWMWCPALGGLAVGLGDLIEPRALGVGYDIIDDLLNSRILPQAVLTILLVKAAIWLVSLSSGTSGVVLAPLLILGGTLGWLVGLVLPGDPGFWALLGMAAMMGGTMRAPLTGTFFAVELTATSPACCRSSPRPSPPMR